MCIYHMQQSMDGIPEYAIPAVVSFLDVEESHRCACISKEWELCARKRIEGIREQATKIRAQVSDLRVQCNIEIQVDQCIIK